MSIDSRSLRLALFASAAALATSGCGGGGSSASSNPSPPPATGNVAAMAVDGGPTVGGSINQSYVTVTVCVPGSTTSCQTIDHVWVDTGSTGLRIFSSVLTLSLPDVQLNSNTVGNCIQFVSSAYAWGAVRTADVKIAGEAASSVPIQVIDDSAVPTTAPTNCSNGGTALNIPTDMGANGLLGIGVFQQDCGLGCQVNTPAPTGFYYTCPGSTCAAVNIATALQVQNVVGMFAHDNNGTLIQLQALPGGSLTTATGNLIFGINTQSNNQLGSAVVFSADPGLTANFRAGDIQTMYGGVTDPASYIDSGSNLWFFNDASINQYMSGGKPTGLYCPTSPLSLQATMLPYDTPTNTASFTYSFSVVNIMSAPDAAFNNAGGPAGASGSGGATFDWGLPFFYGRNVYTGLEGKTIGGHNGPFFAASTP